MNLVKENLFEITEAIDEVLGDGYARRNPELIGRMVQASLILRAADVIQDGLYSIAASEKP